MRYPEYLHPLKLLFFFLMCSVWAFEADTFVKFKGSIDRIKLDSVKCILSDVDGTLLQSNHMLSDETVKSITRIHTLGIPFFLATGRTRKSVIAAAGSKILSTFGRSIDTLPGVYQQGLLVYGPDGNLIFERFLDTDLLIELIRFCKQHNVPVIAYAGERIICEKRCEQTNKITEYSEPLPEEYTDGIENLSKNGVRTHKLILLDNEERLHDIRELFNERFGSSISITKAIPGMLEILPPASSKGEGVKMLLNYIGIDPSNVIAFGDGENDIEMLQLVKYGVAVENAVPSLKTVASFTTLSNNEHGVSFFLDKLL